MNGQFLSSRTITAATVIAAVVGLGVGQSKLTRATAAQEEDSSAAQIKQLQEQVAQLQKKVDESGKSRIVAAGTADRNRRRHDLLRSGSKRRRQAKMLFGIGDPAPNRWIASEVKAALMCQARIGEQRNVRQ